MFQGRADDGGAGRGRSLRPGKLGGPKAAGPGGYCVCPNCGHRTKHMRGCPCYEERCPKCDSPMMREADALVADAHEDDMALALLTDDELRHAGEVLSAMPALQHVYPNHCTGEAAFVALTQVLGPSVVQPCPVGTVLEF